MPKSITRFGNVEWSGFVPVIETESTTTIDGIEHWARGNLTPESKDRIRLILDLYARSKDREFANIQKRWDIDWFWRVDTTGPEHEPLRNRKEFYALNLVDAETEQQLWAYV